MKLEKGKWYKWYQKNHDSIHIGKYFNYPDEGFVKMKPWIVRSIQYDKEGTFDSKFMQDIVEITDLTEIQKLLPDGHEDKVIIFKSERYLAAMKFFNELKEPERSEAIENYDEKYKNDIPSELNNALTNGFDWGKSKQGYKYWNDIRDSIENNTYFKELEPEVLVFGKYKIGDIVVSLTTNGSTREKGSLFIVQEDSTPHKLCYATYHGSMNSYEWRLATSEEVEAYNNGIINIADIKPTSLEGRYIKCLKENDWNNGKTKVGDVLKIRKSDSVGDLFIGPYCLDNSRLRDGEFELLPIDYIPEPIKEETILDKPSGLITRDVSILSTSTFYGNTPYSYPLTPKEDYPNYSLPVPTNIILKTKIKSIKL